MAGLVVLIMGTVSAPAAISTPAAEITDGTTWPTAEQYTVGWKFTLNEPITVTHLGVFDADGGGLAQNHLVRLYNATSDTILATATIPQATPGELTGAYNSHFVAVTPIDLTTGVQYIIAKQNGWDNFRYDVPLPFPPEINWIEGPGRAGALPANVSGFTIHRTIPYAYFGPNLKFIPEPATLALLALGACLPLCRRRSRQR